MYPDPLEYLNSLVGSKLSWHVDTYIYRSELFALLCASYCPWHASKYETRKLIYLRNRYSNYNLQDISGHPKLHPKKKGRRKTKKRKNKRKNKQDSSFLFYLKRYHLWCKVKSLTQARNTTLVKRFVFTRFEDYTHRQDVFFMFFLITGIKGLFFSFFFFKESSVYFN